MAFYKKRICRPDSPQELAERLAYQTASSLALAETLSKFSPLTQENFAEADAYRIRRVNELLKEELVK